VLSDSCMVGNMTSRKKIAVRLGALIGLPLAVLIVFLSHGSGQRVYSVAQVRKGLLSAPNSWIGRTILIRALDIAPGGSVAWLTDPGATSPSQGLPVTVGSWQNPTFPRNLIWWLSSNISILSGIDGGRVEIYRITIMGKLNKRCGSCAVGRG